MTATVLRLKAGPFLGSYSVSVGWDLAALLFWQLPEQPPAGSAHQLFHLKRVKTNHLPDFPSALGSLILSLPEKTGLWSRVVN